MEGVTAIETFEIKEEEDGVEEDEESAEEDVEDTTMPEDASAADSRDESTDLKLCSMRCQDCGQQFTRWEAFKTHLRMHVLEEEEGRRRSNKRNTEDGGQSDEEEPAPEKRQRTSRDRGDAEEDAESSDVDVDGVDDSIFDSSWQVKPSEIIKVRPRVAMLSAEEKPIFNNSNRVYACAICGKVYSYLESFRNHQKMHENEAVRGQEHKCPDCGKSFVRPALLMAHLKVHRSPMQTEPFAMKCAQCNKSFSSMQTWMSHMDIHKQKPFWCLACAKGFKDEVALDKHLQGHNLKRHQCNICFKNFRVPAELRYHYNTHSGDKPFKCTLCKKTFSQLGNLITHRKKHVGVYVGESEIPVGGKKSRKKMVTEMKKLVFPGVDRSEDFEMEGEEGEREASESAAVSESSSEESGSESESGSDSVESAEEGEPAAGKGADVAEGGKQDGHGEWECFECGMELDQEADLHLHYMKHARGELPVH